MKHKIESALIKVGKLFGVRLSTQDEIITWVNILTQRAYQKAYQELKGAQEGYVNTEHLVGKYLSQLKNSQKEIRQLKKQIKKLKKEK